MVYGVSGGSEQVFLVLPPAAGDPHSVAFIPMNDDQQSLPLREIAPPLPVWDLGDLAFWAGGSVLVLVLSVALVVWLMRWARRPRFPRLPDEPGLRALRDLEDLCSVADSLSCEELAGRGSAVLRSFLHRRYGMLASFATSRELAGQPGSDEPPAPPEVVPLVVCLEEFDALRFGGDRSAAGEVLGVIDRAVAILGGGERGAAGGGRGNASGVGMGTIEQPYHLATVKSSGPIRSGGDRSLRESSAGETGSVVAG